jgi:hypothetical protein
VDVNAVTVLTREQVELGAYAEVSELRATCLAAMDERDAYGAALSAVQSHALTLPGGDPISRIVSETFGSHPYRDLITKRGEIARLTAERDTALARAERSERVVAAAKAWRGGEVGPLRAAVDAYDEARDG